MNNQHLVTRSGAESRIILDGLPADCSAAASLRDAAGGISNAAINTQGEYKLIFAALALGCYELEVILIAQSGSVTVLHRGILEVHEAISAPAAALAGAQVIHMTYHQDLAQINVSLNNYVPPPIEPVPPPPVARMTVAGLRFSSPPPNGMNSFDVGISCASVGGYYQILDKQTALIFGVDAIAWARTDSRIAGLGGIVY